MRGHHHRHRFTPLIAALVLVAFGIAAGFAAGSATGDEYPDQPGPAATVIVPGPAATVSGPPQGLLPSETAIPIGNGGS